MTKTQATEELIKTFAIIRQLVHRKLGMFGSSTLADDLYYFRQAILIITSDVGEEILKEHYGEEYPDVKRRVLQYGIHLSKIKAYYDSIKDKNFEEHKKEQLLKAMWRKHLSRIPLVDSLLFEIFVILVKQTSLKYQKIPHDAFKVFEREYKKFEWQREKKKPEETAHSA